MEGCHEMVEGVWRSVRFWLHKIVEDSMEHDILTSLDDQVHRAMDVLTVKRIT